ncbi:MAG: carbohydrate ABC transporter permease [Phycisphaerae bacterium]
MSDRPVLTPNPRGGPFSRALDSVRRRPGRAVKLMLLYTTLSFTALLMLTPLVWLVACAFKPREVFFTYTFFAPLSEMSLENFDRLFSQLPFFRLMVNSMFITGATVMVQLFFASLGGFALAKYEFRGKRPIMLLMLATMMIPPQVMLAPMYELLCNLRLVDSYVGLIVPGMVSVFGMFLFRQSMMQIPDEMLEAARVDGCSEFGLYWRVAVPVSRPMIGAFCLLSFMGVWNSFIWPAIILQNSQRFTLPLGLNQLVGLQQQDYGAMMAGTLLSILPVVVLFFVLQKEFISGLTAGAVKG